MNLDATLPAWIRHYAVLLTLSMLLGLGGTFLYIQLREDPYEFSTIVVGSGSAIIPRQLGPVARSLFESRAVYEPVIRDLGVKVGTDDFFRDHAEIVPLLEAPSLVVLGRSPSRETAEQISIDMANQLVEALNRQVGDQELRIFSGPEPSRLPGKLGASLILASGALVGLWTGIAAALIHYRWRRPVLTLHQALALSGAAHLTIFDNQKSTGWRYLRSRRWSKSVARDDVRLAWLERSIAGRPVQLQTLKSSAAAKRIRRQLGSSLSSDDEQGAHLGSEDMLVMVAGAGTTEEAIVASRLAAGSTQDSRQDRIALVWLR